MKFKSHSFHCQFRTDEKTQISKTKGEKIMKPEATLALFPEGSSSSTHDSRENKHSRVSRREGPDNESSRAAARTFGIAPHGSHVHHTGRGKVTTEDPLLTVDEFAEALRVTRACVRKWILMRKVGVVKVGRLVRLRSSELRRIVEEGLRPRLEKR